MNAANIVEIKNHPEFSVIHLSGFVDAGSVDQIKPVINKEIPPMCSKIIIDLEKVEFLDSHGVGFLVSLLKKIHAQRGKMIFLGAVDQPASVLNMVGFNGSLVTYCSNMQEAEDIMKNGDKSPRAFVPPHVK